VAMSDPEGILASPNTIITYNDDKEAIDSIIEIVNRQEIRQIIVGLPRALDGSLGMQAEKVQAFVQKLVDAAGVPIEFRDERMTTVLARRLMRAASDKKNIKRKTLDDAAAAAVILQAYLDEKRVPVED
ncbi:MAG: Holliday junction resolvase RuvX, partial [bacterium]|nr:Holliday junction resolvase RuvX [bacterium]